MQLHQYSIMAVLAIFIGTMSLTTGESNAKLSCCTKVSTEEIKVPILSYSFQNGKLPCVPAIVFETTDGVKICSAPKRDWVRRIVRELRSLKTQGQRGNSTTTGSPMTTQL